MRLTADDLKILRIIREFNDAGRFPLRRSIVLKFWGLPRSVTYHDKLTSTKINVVKNRLPVLRQAGLIEDIDANDECNNCLRYKLTPLGRSRI